MKTYHGSALSWDLNDQVIEVELHRAPANEIGTTALRELELLAEMVAEGAHGAKALITHSSRSAGFSAGADLRELYEGLSGQRSGGGTVASVRRGVGGLMASVERRLTPLLNEATAAGLKRTAEAGGRTVLQPLLTPLIIRRVRAFLQRIHAVFNTLDTAPLVTIAATHGVVFGGGFELALVHDVIVADKSTRFAFPELRLGLVPGFGGIPRLERDVGNAVVRDLLLTGRSLNARRAHALGLVSQVTARGKALHVARTVARQAARFDSPVVAAGKRFCKPVPTARLQEEIDTFCTLMRDPRVFRALHRFVSSTDVRPYLP